MVPIEGTIAPGEALGELLEVCVGVVSSSSYLGKYNPGLELGDREFQCAGTGVPLAGSVAAAGVGTVDLLVPGQIGSGAMIDGTVLDWFSFRTTVRGLLKITPWSSSTSSPLTGRRGARYRFVRH